MLSEGFLTATAFRTEANHDKLTLQGVDYSGLFGPYGVVVSAGSTMSWESDNIGTAAGWKVCWSNTSVAPTTAPPTMPRSEARGLLMEFYDLTGGPRWVNNNGWDSAADICEDWHGVYCHNGKLYKM